MGLHTAAAARRSVQASCFCQTIITVLAGSAKLAASEAGGRAFEVRFLGGRSLPGLEIQLVCQRCGAIHLYSEVRYRHDRAALAAAALEGRTLPAGWVRSWKADAGDRPHFLRYVAAALCTRRG